MEPIDITDLQARGAAIGPRKLRLELTTKSIALGIGAKGLVWSDHGARHQGKDYRTMRQTCRWR